MTSNDFKGQLPTGQLNIHAKGHLPGTLNLRVTPGQTQTQKPKFQRLSSLNTRLEK